MQNQLAIRSLFEFSRPGQDGPALPECDVEELAVESLLPASALTGRPGELPELTEPDIIRHFVNLSKLNMSVDTHFYPLGSCTMKYNPKRHERLAGVPGLRDLHPAQSVDHCQGMLEILYSMQEMLGEIAGLPAVSLQPAAGAHGELTALLVASAYFRDQGEKRTRVIFPSSAHGTNPASAAVAGFDTVQMKHSKSGFVDLNELRSLVDERTAVFMVTNPNTLGLFERDIKAISDLLHSVGGLMYIDGANMNAILGVTRPGDFGGDMMHYNVHKTFTGPHGAGGPGAGPIAVRDFLADYLPGPVISREENGGEVRFDLRTPPKSIGKVRSFYGNIGILLRGYFYLRTLGAAGVRDVSEQAVLNANYLKKMLSDLLPTPHGELCMHEFVGSIPKSLRERGISAMDLAKGLLDEGFHPPTVYFPLDVPEAVMVEPTETESKATLDAFCEAVRKVLSSTKEDLKASPKSTLVSRPDEVRAAKELVLRWQPSAASADEAESDAVASARVP